MIEEKKKEKYIQIFVCKYIPIEMFVYIMMVIIILGIMFHFDRINRYFPFLERKGWRLTVLIITVTNLIGIFVLGIFLRGFCANLDGNNRSRRELIRNWNWGYLERTSAFGNAVGYIVGSIQMGSNYAYNNI